MSINAKVNRLGVERNISFPKLMKSRTSNSIFLIMGLSENQLCYVGIKLYSDAIYTMMVDQWTKNTLKDTLIDFDGEITLSNN